MRLMSAKDPRYFCSAKSTRSELAIPLMVRDEVVGVLDCQSEHEDYFDSETIDLLTLFSTQASIALQNARLYSLEQQRARQLQAINAIAQQTTAVLDLEELLDHSVPVDTGCLPGFARVAFFERGAGSGSACASRNANTAHSAGRAVSARPMSHGPAFLASSATTRETDLRKATSVKFFAESASRMRIPLVSFGQTLGDSRVG